MARTTIEEFQQKANVTVSFLQEELKKIRSGRANPALVENITVEAYGDAQPLKNVASITVADPTMVVIQPWDKSLVAEISKAIQKENLGMNPQVSGDLVRVPVPTLTEERRKEYVKIMKDQLEESRISIRSIRKDVMVGLSNDKDEGVITEDDYHRHEKNLQEMVNTANNEIEEIGENKEKELMQV
jgi:ribosome recycling factor